MSRRDATIPRDADMLTDDLLRAVPEEKDPQHKPAPERAITPHEISRSARQMSVTFPTPQWRPAIATQAAKWDMRPSDLLIYCISYTMQAIEAGQVKRPPGHVDRFRHRTGEGLELPWNP